MDIQEVQTDTHQENPWLQVSSIRTLHQGTMYKLEAQWGPFTLGWSTSQPPHCGGYVGRGWFFRPPSAECPKGPSRASVFTWAGPLHQQSQLAAHWGVFALEKIKFRVQCISPSIFNTAFGLHGICMSPWQRSFVWRCHHLTCCHPIGLCHGVP